MKKTAILFLMTVFTILTAWAGGNTETTAGKPLVWLTSVQGSNNPEGMEAFEAEVERLTGIKVDIIRASGDEFDNKMATMLAGGDHLDIVTTGKYQEFVEKGFVSPLEDMIMASEVLSDPAIIDPMEWERIRTDEGHIYGVFNKFEQGTMPIIRQDWMEKLGLEDPQTLDEYYQVLKAFTEQDPDGNGVDDTYGLVIGYTTYDLTPFFGAYGLQRGFQYDSQGKLYAPWTTDEAIPVYEFMKRLYDEGILEPNFITNNSSDFRGLFMNDKAGMNMYWAAWVGLYNQTVRNDRPGASFVARGIAPPEGPGGRLLRAGDDGLMMIPVNSARKEDAFKIMEMWHTHEGNILSTLGVLDYDYTLSDGTYTLTEAGRQAAMDHGAPQPKSLGWVNPFGELPGFDEAKELILMYGRPQMPHAGNKDWEAIVRSEAGNIILGKMTAREGVANMRNRLRLEGIIE